MLFTATANIKLITKEKRIDKDLNINTNEKKKRSAIMNLNLILSVFIIWFSLLETVSSTLAPHNASDGQTYLIETDQEVCNFL